MIKWYGAFKIENNKVVKSFIFPPDRRAEILKNIRKGEYGDIEFLGNDEIKFEGEIKDKEELVATAIELAKLEMRENLKDDYLLIETLNTYDDVISIINLLSERVSEWEKIGEIRGEPQKVGEILKEKIEDMEKLKDEMSRRIEELTDTLCPNLSTMVGPIIAARVVAAAGGLPRLAKLPASTIQVLGAEESFFRHLKSGAKCPKHGLIFRVPEVRNAPKRLRGKIARSLAAKIAIAARVDYYKGEFIGDKLREDFLKRVEEIKNDSGGKRRRMQSPKDGK